MKTHFLKGCLKGLLFFPPILLVENLSEGNIHQQKPTNTQFLGSKKSDSPPVPITYFLGSSLMPLAPLSQVKPLVLGNEVFPRNVGFIVRETGSESSLKFWCWCIFVSYQGQIDEVKFLP